MGNEGVRSFETMRLHQFNIAQDLPRVAVSKDPPLIEQDNAITHFQDELQIVRGNKHSFLRRRLEEIDEAAPVADIEV